MNASPVLTFLMATPLVGGLLLLGMNGAPRNLPRLLALFCNLVTGLQVAVLWNGFDLGLPEFQFPEQYDWVPALGIEYRLGLDGVSLLMVLLTALVTPMAILVSADGGEREPLHVALLLLVQAGLFGTFTALNFFHWFLFWELSLIPAFFLIKLWGGSQRGPAATQFFVYTMSGSVALLLAFLAVYLATGTFDFSRLAELGRSGELASALSVRLGWYGLSTETLAGVIFALAFVGFAVKVPIMPFHTWLPLAYAEAPPGTTMVLTGLMSKMGVYGILRILLPIFPEQMRQMQAPLLCLALLTIVFSAGAAIVQRDLKRVFAYSSVNHLGYCFLGIVAAIRLTGPEDRWSLDKVTALNGVLLQMFNHGLTAAALFGFLGFLERRSGGLRSRDDFGGLRRVAPVFCGLMGIAIFASLGLPGLNGFVGEFLIFKGALALAPWAAALALAGLLGTAVFLLSIMQSVFHGPLPERWAGFADLSRAERWTLIPAVALMLALGIYPQPALEIVNRTVMHLVEHLKY